MEIAKCGMPWRKFQCPVERVDDPAVGPVAAPSRAPPSSPTISHMPAAARASSSRRIFLGALIGRAYEIARALERDLQVLKRCRAIALEPAARPCAALVIAPRRSERSFAFAILVGKAQDKPARQRSTGASDGAAVKRCAHQRGQVAPSA